MRSKIKGKRVLATVSALMIIVGLIIDFAGREKADILVVFAMAGDMQEEEYNFLADRIRTAAGDLTVKIDSVTIHGAIDTSGESYSYNDRISIIKLMTEIQDLKCGLYLLDGATLELIKSYNDEFFEETISLDQLPIFSNDTRINEEALACYQICLRAADTYKDAKIYEKSKTLQEHVKNYKDEKETIHAK